MFALWLLLVGSLALDELLAGVVAAALATAGADAVWRADPARFRPRARWLLGALRLPWRTARDTTLLCWALVLHLFRRRLARGALRTVAIDLRGSDPRAVSRRALAVAGISFPPNTYVIFVHRRAPTILVHELVPSRGGRGGLA